LRRERSRAASRLTSRFIVPIMAIGRSRRGSAGHRSVASSFSEVPSSSCWSSRCARSHDSQFTELARSDKARRDRLAQRPIINGFLLPSFVRSCRRYLGG
jgi:hypothetical protein